MQPFFHTRSPLRSRSPDFWPAPLQLRSAPAPKSSSKLKKWTDFYRASYDSAILAVVILYVCLSVRLSVFWYSRALWQNQTMQCGYFDTTRKGNHPGFLKPTVVDGQRPLRLKFALKVTQPSKTRRLRPISAYKVSTVRDGEKSSVTTNGKSTSGFPTSYRWSLYVTPKYLKWWLKKRFFVFLNKSLLRRFLCENFQRQRCSIEPFPYLTVHRYLCET